MQVEGTIAVTAQNIANVVINMGEQLLGLRVPVVSWELVETILGEAKRLLLQPHRQRQPATGYSHVELLSVTLQAAVLICGQCVARLCRITCACSAVGPANESTTRTWQLDVVTYLNCLASALAPQNSKNTTSGDATRCQ